MDLSVFSLTRTGSLPFDAEVDVASLPNHLAGRLRAVKASTVEIEGNRVVFTRRMFRLVSNWNVLVPFESGDLTVDPYKRLVTYRVSIRELVFFGTGVVLVMTLIMAKLSAWQPILFMPLMWLWLVVGNLLIGVFQFKGFLARAISNAPCSVTQTSPRVR